MRTWVPAGDDAFHLRLVPVAGVCEHDRWDLVNAGELQFAADGVEHRLEVPEIRRRDRDLGGDHNLLLVAGGLRVVALQPAAHPLHQPGVHVGRVDRALRRRRRRVGLGRRAGSQPPAVLHHATRPIGLIRLVGLAFHPQLFFQAPL
jgi:hypothetical protein